MKRMKEWREDKEKGLRTNIVGASNVPDVEISCPNTEMEMWSSVDHTDGMKL